MIGSFIVPRGYETSRLLRKQLMEEQEQALELERRHLAELQLARKHPAGQTYFGYSMDDLKVSNGILFYQFVSFSFVLIFIGWFACFSFYIFFFFPRYGISCSYSNTNHSLCRSFQFPIRGTIQLSVGCSQ